MSIIMKDQANKDWLAPEKPLWPAEQQATECMACVPLAIITLAALVAALAMAFNSPALAGSTTDLLISDDMADYLSAAGAGQVVQDYDME